MARSSSDWTWGRAWKHIKDWIDDHTEDCDDDPCPECLTYKLFTKWSEDWPPEDGRELYEILGSHDMDSFHDDGIPGYGYNEMDADRLVAFQQTFARLYKRDEDL